MSYYWKVCCKKEIANIWQRSESSMNVVFYMGECPICKHFIGLTQTSKEKAKKFLGKKFNEYFDKLDKKG